MTPLTPARARKVFLLLTATRWFPVGLVVTVTTLLPLERGLSVTQALTALSITGLTVFFLELPTSGLADTLGRRPLLVMAAVLQVAAAVLFLTAQSFWAFALAAGVAGAFRALDSGPLEAWFVDTVHATEPGADVDRPLAAHGTVMGVSIAAGALISGGLVWWHPLDAWSALTLPYAVYATLALAHLVAVTILVREVPRVSAPEADGTGTGGPGAAPALPPSGTGSTRVAGRVLQSARQAPGVIRDGLRLARDNRVLRWLLLVEVFWSVGMVVFETFQPIRLSEMLGGTAAGAAVAGPAAAAGWAVFAGGAALTGLATPRIGVARTAILARVLNGLGAVWMGLALGPVGLVAAYLVTYGLHGACGPAYQALLHREAESRNRSTVLSMASMLSFASFSLAGPVLGWTSDVLSTSAAMVLAGTFSTLGAACFLPALRRERMLAASAKATVPAAVG
ncbi:Major Facilitator Superfamily protein [Promicromonospora umidemergens]|uniref:Major facilitator superfamily (MFS) profile domain-containing protein n=1 Tax=Promicromonospora umidemergens TaxID=629679 RepID=A0ABP8Y3H4_9MICO|nr:MFS transporter [Promicromonospora umidemergens]MCP2284600.1 Major Facilitator Superfamily protein [Promicromonospora umidemergens]